MALDVLTLGNAIVDLLIALDDANPACRIDHATHELCIKAGEKILAKHVGFAVGGGACRVAIGLSRLGKKTAILAEIGQDEFASRIEKTLQEEGVVADRLEKTDTMTSVTAGINFQKERTLFTYLTKGKHEFDFSSLTPRWVYVAALGTPWEKSYQDVVVLKASTSCKIAFNPGPSQLQEDPQTYHSLLSVTDVVFVNKQEAQTIARTESEDMKQLLGEVQKTGPRVVVITDGRNGSFALDENSSYFQLALYPSVVVERTGAGDAYAAGFLAALLEGLSLEKGMLWGTLNASAVVEEFGGLSGLLTSEKLQAILKKSDIPQVITL